MADNSGIDLKLVANLCAIRVGGYTGDWFFNFSIVFFYFGIKWYVRVGSKGKNFPLTLSWLTIKSSAVQGKIIEIFHAVKTEAIVR